MPIYNPYWTRGRQRDPKSNGLYKNSGALANKTFRIEFDFLHPAGIENQTTDALQQLRTAGKDEMRIEADIPALCPTSSNPPKNEESRFIYMQEGSNRTTSVVSDYKIVYGVARTTKRDDEKRPITAQEFVHQQRNDSYCRQASSAVRFSRLKYNYGRNWILTPISPNDGAI